MPARQNYYAESLAETTSTSTFPNATPKLTRSFTPDANSSYLILWSCSMACSQAGNATRRPQATLKNITSGVTYNDQSDSPRLATSEYKTRGGIFVESFGASPAQQDYQLDWGNVTGTADTIRIRQATFIAIKLGSADQSIDAGSATQAVTSTSYVNLPTTRARLQWSPATAGEFLLIATAEAVNSASATGAIGLQLINNGNSATFGEAVKCTQATAGYMHWAAVAVVSLGTSAQDFEIQAKSVAGSNVNVRRARIIAIRLDVFPAYYFDEDRTRTTTATSTFVDKSIVSETVAASDFLVVASSCLDSGSNAGSNRPLWQVTEDGSSKIRVEETPQVATTHDHAYWAMFRSTMSAGSHDWKTQFANNAVVTTGCSDSAIAVLQLDASGTTYTQSASVTAVGSVALSRQVQLSEAVSASSAVALVRQIQLLRAVTGSGTVSSTQDEIGAAAAASFALRKTAGGSAPRGGDAIRLDAVAGPQTFSQSAAVTAVATASMLRQVNLARAVSASSTTSVSTTRSLQRSHAVTASSTVSIKRQISKSFAVTAAASVAVSTLRSLKRSLAVTASGVVAVSKAHVRSFSVTATSSVSVAASRALRRSHAVTATASTAVSKRVSRVVSVTASGSVAVSTARRLLKSFSVTAAASVSVLKAQTRSFAVTAVSSVSVSSAIAYARNVSVTAVASVAAATLTARQRAFSVTGTAQTAIKRDISLSRGVSAVSSVSAGRQAFYIRTASVTAVGVVSETHARMLLRTHSVTGLGVVDVQAELTGVFLHLSVVAVGIAAARLNVTDEMLDRIVSSADGPAVILVDGNPALKVGGKLYTKA